LKESAPFNVVVDLGAGTGVDLALAKSTCPSAELHAVEAYPPYVAMLSEMNVHVHPLDLENDPLPFQNESVDVVIINQVLEHVKELFWIMHESSRVLRGGI